MMLILLPAVDVYNIDKRGCYILTAPLNMY